MKPYSLLPSSLLLSRVTSAPAPASAPDITYNPTKEAPCLVSWDVQTNHDATEHYEVTGSCTFLDSVDELCKGGYRAPGFCPNENDRPVDCCIRRKCGKNGLGVCINRDIPIEAAPGTHYSLQTDSTCPTFWGAPAVCVTSMVDNLSTPEGQPVRNGLSESSPSPIQPEAQQPQPLPNALSFNINNNNNNNNNNLWTVPTTVADANKDGAGGGGGIQQQDVGFDLFDQQLPPVAALSVAANGGGAAGDAEFSLLGDNQPLISLGANGAARDGIINPDGSPVDGNGAPTDGFFFNDTS